MIRSSQKPPKTAAELMGSLQKDPDYRARVVSKNAARARAIADFELNSRPVLDDLRSIGIQVNSLDQLRESGKKYKTVIPLLTSWLTKTDNDKVREAIVRALTVPWAADLAEKPLIDLYLSLDNSGNDSLRWAIGNALSVVATDRYFDQLLEIVRNRRHGTTRQMIVLGLANKGGERIESALIDLLADPDVAGHAIMTLGKIGTTRAETNIASFLNHKTPWIRREAKKALSSIGARSNET
ncbi:MAG: HEAT repeat domain-containing protein [Beijerinckiaceae bacterium]